jgi:hypothetical protein
MKLRLTFFIALLALFIAFAALVLATSNTRTDVRGVTYLSHAPLFEISWAPKKIWMITKGFNFVWNTPYGPPGTFIEFPISPSERASLRLWTPRWSKEYRNLH